MDTGKNRMVGRRYKKGAERHPFCRPILSASLSLAGSGCHDGRRSGNGDSGRGISWKYFATEYGQSEAGTAYSRSSAMGEGPISYGCGLRI